MQNHYCLQCGTQMKTKWLEERPREICPACGWIYYLHLRIGAGTVISKDGKLLLGKRSIDPWKDAWNMPAGFCEADEHPKQTAVRETLEETGLVVRTNGLFGLYFFDDDPRGNGLVVLYSAEIVSGEITTNSETSSLQYFSPEEMPEKIAGGGHTEAVQDWLSRAKTS